MNKFSIFSLMKNAFTNHENWQEHWRSPEPKKRYDAVIIGGGCHGLATAYYLAKEFGMTNIAVIEKGYIGGGNSGRNTTIVRSNYMWDESAKIYEHALKKWEGLSQELNYNVMFSQRGVINLAHSVHDLQEMGRRGTAIHLNGIDTEFLTPEQIKKKVPLLNMNGRYPVLGGLLQKRAGNARHDAVVWGYARAADSLGVDIIQGCEVLGFDIKDGKVQGVKTSKGDIKTKKVGIVAAGHSSVLADMAGFRLPLESVPLQALVSESIKPVLDTVVMSNAVHVYLSQSDKGSLVIGAGTDEYVSYSQRGSFDVIDHIMAPIVELFPFVSRVKMLRQWAGITDCTTDRSPVVSKTPVKGIMINCGWGTGGFKATPGSGHAFAESIAKGEMSDIAAPFSIDRHYDGYLIDEAAAAGVAH